MIHNNNDNNNNMKHKQKKSDTNLQFYQQSNVKKFQQKKKEKNDKKKRNESKMFASRNSLRRVKWIVVRYDVITFLGCWLFPPSMSWIQRTWNLHPLFLSFSLYFFLSFFLFLSLSLSLCANNEILYYSPAPPRPPPLPRPLHCICHQCAILSVLLYLFTWNYYYT